MSPTTVFSKSVRQTKKKNKAKLLFRVLRRIIRNNPKLFIFCGLLAIITAIINYNVMVNLREAFTKGLSENSNVFEAKIFKFQFNFLGWILKKENLGIWEFIAYSLLLIFVIKSTFSIIHYYWMNYGYDRIEQDLKKDLFQHFIRAKYANSVEVSRNLITQFASDLDEIAYSIWFIPNRLIYVVVAISCYVLYEFNFGKDGKINWFFLAIAFALFIVLIISEVILFKKASKLNVAAKKRQEEDNKVIYERINNLEYIKAVSGEKYEEAKVSQQLDATFRKNKKALWYSTMFKTIPSYMVVPNIPIFFLATTLTLVDESSKISAVYTVGNFSSYFMSVKGLNSEVGKIVDALLTLDELSSNLEIVNESVQVLHRPLTPVSQKLALRKTQSFVDGDIIFQKVIFAYPKRPQQDILRNFTFTFQQGKIYGIAGKNGIGKSTITKTTLKLYDLSQRTFKL